MPTGDASSGFDLTGRRLATLGPAGTDAEAEAVRLNAEVLLCPSFPEAMRLAVAEDCLALVAAGYVDTKRSGGSNWVDLHFEHLGRLALRAVWESPTKPMCVAVNTTRSREPGEIRSLALHPSTRALTVGRVPDSVQMTFVTAKPLAVELAARGEVDACIGSEDVVRAHSQLAVVARFQPTMVWCLYGVPEQRKGVT